MSSVKDMSKNDKVGFVKQRFTKNRVMITLAGKNGIENYLVKIGKSFKTKDGKTLLLTKELEIKTIGEN